MSRWIKVEDKKPPMGVPVLLASQLGVIMKGWLNWDGDAFDIPNEESYYSFEYFTHWMPLPEPPKEKE